MKKRYITPTTLAVRLSQHESLLISSLGNDKDIQYGGASSFDDDEEPR